MVESLRYVDLGPLFTGRRMSSRRGPEGSHNRLGAKSLAPLIGAESVGLVIVGALVVFLT